MEVKAKPARTSARGGTAVPVEKKELERERRQRMKALCEKLASCIPKEYFPHSVIKNTLLFTCYFFLITYN